MNKIEGSFKEHLLAAAKAGRMPGHVLFCGLSAADRRAPVAFAAKALALPGFRFMGGELEGRAQLKGLLSVPEYGAIVVVEDLDLLKPEAADRLHSIMAGGKMPAFGDPELTLYLPPLMVIGFASSRERVDKKLFNCFRLKLGCDPL